MTRRQPPRRAISLFSGAGGLDSGLSAAGWNVLTQIEIHHDAADTLRANSAGSEVRVIEEPVERVAASTLRRQLGLPRGELGLLAGGPPCQPFTTTGRRLAINDQRAREVFPGYLAFVDEFQPQALLIENVDGMLSAALRHRPLAQRGTRHPALRPDEQKGSFLRWFLMLLAERGYAVAWGVTEAADFGVPQLRQRAILIGVKGLDPCYLPGAQFGRPGLPRYRTVRDALGGVRSLGPVQPLSIRKQRVYARIPAGGNWRDLPRAVQRATMGAAFHAEGGKSGWWRRLSWDQPAPTILGMPDHSSTGLIHPDEVRCVSVNEAAALQTFPADYRFAGTPRSQYQQIGNAVPPTLAAQLGIHLADFLDGRREEPPTPPDWRKQSANRRIGTHGWVIPARRGPEIHLAARVRTDHVWASREHARPLFDLIVA